MTVPWTLITGREIDSTPLKTLAHPKRIVACLNVWNDVGALRHTMPIWAKFVDRILVVDGAYDTIGRMLSSDGTREFVQSFGHKVQLLDALGKSQCEKRSMFFEHSVEGDYLFVVDADERVFDPQKLQSIPFCDVAWVQMRSATYQRPYGQPRIFRWQSGMRYAGRHHWVYRGEDLVCTHQYSGPGFVHAPIAMTIENQRHLSRSSARMQYKSINLARQTKVETPNIALPTSRLSDTQVGAREALYIVQHAYRDDGIAPSRFHSAINRTTPHWSLFFKTRPGPFGLGGQYDTRGHSVLLNNALREADVVHFHGVMSASKLAPAGKSIVFHHHGTLFRRNAADYNALAKKANALLLLSNLELFSWTGGLPAHFLPNPMPVARYRELRKGRLPELRAGPFRIGHSPSHPYRKGTKEFLEVCAALKARGLPVEPIVMHNVSHREALLQKASCHAFFDSFWLGIQCSGLEAASMQMPVIAGDSEVAKRYTDWLGHVPYTFANTQEELEAQIVALVSNEEFRKAEADRVSGYALQHHDEAAVALRYLDLLDASFHWRSTLKTANRASRAAIKQPVKPAKAKVRR